MVWRGAKDFGVSGQESSGAQDWGLGDKICIFIV